jgi:hypothetical protein
MPGRRAGVEGDERGKGVAKFLAGAGVLPVDYVRVAAFDCAHIATLSVFGASNPM